MQGPALGRNRHIANSWVRTERTPKSLPRLLEPRQREACETHPVNPGSCLSVFSRTKELEKGRWFLASLAPHPLGWGWGCSCLRFSLATLTSSAFTYSGLAGLELQRKQTHQQGGGGVPTVFCRATRRFQVLPRPLCYTHPPPSSQGPDRVTFSRHLECGCFSNLWELGLVRERGRREGGVGYTARRKGALG